MILRILGFWIAPHLVVNIHPPRRSLARVSKYHRGKWKLTNQKHMGNLYLINGGLPGKYVVDGSEIRGKPVEVGRISHCFLQVYIYIHPKWLGMGFLVTINYVGHAVMGFPHPPPWEWIWKARLLCPKAVNKRSATNSMYCVINSWNPVRGKRVNFGGEFPSLVSHQLPSLKKRTFYTKKETDHLIFQPRDFQGAMSVS